MTTKAVLPILEILAWTHQSLLLLYGGTMIVLIGFVGSIYNLASKSVIAGCIWMIVLCFQALFGSFFMLVWHKLVTGKSSHIDLPKSSSTGQLITEVILLIASTVILVLFITKYMNTAGEIFIAIFGDVSSRERLSP